MSEESESDVTGKKSYVDGSTVLMDDGYTYKLNQSVAPGGMTGVCKLGCGVRLAGYPHHTGSITPIDPVTHRPLTASVAGQFAYAVGQSCWTELEDTFAGYVACAAKLDAQVEHDEYVEHVIPPDDRPLSDDACVNGWEEGTQDWFRLESHANEWPCFVVHTENHVRRSTKRFRMLVLTPAHPLWRVLFDTLGRDE